MLLLIVGLLLCSVVLVWLVRKKPLIHPTASLILPGKSPSEFPLSTTKTSIGRGDKNDLVIKDDTVSSYHADIKMNAEGEFVIIDVDSANGILVNGEPRSTETLNDGDLIELGSTQLRFKR